MATKTATKAPKAAAAKAGSARLKQLYVSQYAAELKKELGLHNPHEVPKLEKITLNIGLGRAKDDKKLLEAGANTLSKITGQKPVETVARLSIASFKLREGNRIGLKVTLRGERMYEFLDRLISLVMPRLRDFHGVSAKAFDKSGNYSLGLREQSVFPELNFEDLNVAHGLQINFTIKSQSPEHSRALLEKFGMPFEKGANREKKES